MALIQYLTTIQFEPGAIRLLPQECERVGMRRPLVVTDKGVIAAGLLERLRAALPSSLRFEVFDETPSNPTEAMVLKAAERYKAAGCDCLIGFGGGSSLDLAKGVAIAATHPGPLTSYATIEGGSPRITPDAAPMIAIPTTAGTGSEVARGAIIIVGDGRKLGFHSWNLVPKAAICDPELTLGLPPQLTAATGMDAIAHCIETFLSPAFNPPADGIALDGLERAWHHIERASRNGADLEARLNMMSASMQGAMAFQKGLGCVHSLSHPLGGLVIDGRTGLHHGTLNAVVMPAVLHFNASSESVVRENKLARLRRTIGVPAGADLGDAVREMNARLGLPAGLAQMGVRREMFESVVAGALRDHCHKTNPREASADDYRQMLELSYGR